MSRVSALLLAFSCLIPVQAAGAEPARVDFARDVKPILEGSCVKCHGAKKQQGNLRLDRRDGALAPGDSGRAAVVPGRAAESEILRRIETTDVAERMPLDAEPLPLEQRKVLRDWIAEGAPWPEEANAATGSRSEMAVTDEDRRHWSYRPLRAIDPPSPGDAAWCRTPIDRFVRAAQEAVGLGPNPPADRRALIRRVYFDLIGLPPTPAEVEAFVADPSPMAYETLVDRLLGSPHHGERWGRHWLDVARYADSGGMESDHDRPHAHHYRDFVIRAFNDDLSYRTFVRWQLAGDEYEPDNPEALAATGFLTGAPNEMLTDQHLEEERLRLRFNELDDMAVTSTSAFLGLTLGCARCHDHKFDAIPARDYYRIQCAFTTTTRADVLLAPRAEVSRYRESEAQFGKKLEGTEARLRTWLSGKKIPEKQVKALDVPEKEYRAFSDEDRRAWDALRKELEAVRRERPASPPAALAIADRGAEPVPTFLLERGDFYSRKERLELGFLSVLTSGKAPEEYLASARREAPPERSTLQRRAMADWITDTGHGAGALLARVMVNRVWQHHFGEGIVRTVSDFGLRGEKPTHPELLEWLARDFVDGDWKLKRLHRLIVTSAAYMQNGSHDEERARIDPDNRLLWRRRPQRLEAEILRDAVLSVSGTLNLERFGPAFKPPIPADAIVARNTKDPYPQDARDTPETRRRTVYMFHKRVVQHPLIQVFDGPDAAVSCGRRSSTTVAPQALALLNDTFMRDRAEDFARRILAEAGGERAAWVDRGFRLALARAPSPAELAASVEFLENQAEGRLARERELGDDGARLQALADFCQTLFAANEFIYTD